MIVSSKCMLQFCAKPVIRNQVAYLVSDEISQIKNQDWIASQAKPFKSGINNQQQNLISEGIIIRTGISSLVKSHTSRSAWITSANSLNTKKKPQTLIAITNPENPIRPEQMEGLVLPDLEPINIASMLVPHSPNFFLTKALLLNKRSGTKVEFENEAQTMVVADHLPQKSCHPSSQKKLKTAL